MSEVDDVWRQKSDEQVLEAFMSLDDYGSDGQRAIRAEFVRRSLAVPTTTPITCHEAEAVARLHRWFAGLVFAQSLSLAAIVWTPLGYSRFDEAAPRTHLRRVDRRRPSHGLPTLEEAWRRTAGENCDAHVLAFI